jgi:hypothetical protein
LATATELPPQLVRWARESREKEEREERKSS